MAKIATIVGLDLTSDAPYVLCIPVGSVDDAEYVLDFIHEADNTVTTFGSYPPDGTYEGSLYEGEIGDIGDLVTNITVGFGDDWEPEGSGEGTVGEIDIDTTKSLVPAAVSSQLDNTGEERVHAAPIISLVRNYYEGEGGDTDGEGETPPVGGGGEPGGGGGGGGENPETPDPPVDPEPEETFGIAQNGGPADAHTGGSGGYPDENPYFIPRPTVFDTNLITDGEFDLANWKTQTGQALPAYMFTEDAGALQFKGSATGVAYGYGYRRSLPYMAFPRYDVTVTADVSATDDTLISVGIGWGTDVGGVIPVFLDVSEPEAHDTTATISHTWRYINTGTSGGAGFASRYNIINFMPVVKFAPPSVIAEGEAANISLVISEVPVPTTPEVIDHLDFDTGLADWVLFPDPENTNPYVPVVTVEGGYMVMTPHSPYVKYRWAMCKTPITTADEINKWVKLVGEIWTNDNSYANTNVGIVPSGGVVWGLAQSFDGGETLFPVAGGITERGDFTERDVWMRVIADDSNAPGITYHPAILMQCAVGKTCKAKLTSIEVSDEPVD